MSKFWKKIFTSKYTGKQIDEAVGKVLDGDVGMTNPMTAAGDIIIGGTDGEPEKLAKGSDGKVLKMVSGAPGWADDAGGMENPMTAAGDMIIGGTDGAATRLPKGTDGQVLTLASGAPAWAAAGGGGAEHLYWHNLTINSYASTNKPYSCFIIIISTSATAYTKDTFCDFAFQSGTIFPVVSGLYFFDSTDGYGDALYARATIEDKLIFGVCKRTDNSIVTVTVNNDNNLTLTDTVNQIF